MGYRNGFTELISFIFLETELFDFIWTEVIKENNILTYGYLK